MRSTISTLLLAAGVGLGVQGASAADLPVRKAAPAPVMVAQGVDWSGFYIGAHVGGAWGTIETSLPLGQFADLLPILDGTLAVSSGNINGLIGGGQIGFNIQSGVFVFGVEAEASWSNAKGSSPCILVATCEGEVEWMGTLTGRLGFTADKALIYVEGGGAFASFNYRGTTAILPILGAPFDDFTSASEDKWGWTIGAGIEYAFLPNWSAKLEYNYLDFGKDSTGFALNPEIPLVGGFPFELDIKQQIHSVKFGLNYRFGSNAPISARY